MLTLEESEKELTAGAEERPGTRQQGGAAPHEPGAQQAVSSAAIQQGRDLQLLLLTTTGPARGEMLPYFSGFHSLS